MRSVLGFDASIVHWNKGPVLHTRQQELCKDILQGLDLGLMFHRITSPQLESRCCRWYPWYLSKFPNTTKLSAPSLCHKSPDFLIHVLSGMHRAKASPRRLNEEYPSNYITSLPLDSISQMQKTSEKSPPSLYFSITGVQKASSESDLHNLRPARLQLQVLLQKNARRILL